MVVLSYSPSSALAAAGGRMRYRSFSARLQFQNLSDDKWCQCGPAQRGRGWPIVLSDSGIRRWSTVPSDSGVRFDCGSNSETLVESVSVAGGLPSITHHEYGYNIRADKIIIVAVWGVTLLSWAIAYVLHNPPYKASVIKLQVDVKSNMENMDKRFKSLSIEERGKLDEDTFVNLNNIEKQRTTRKKSTGFNNGYIVVNIPRGSNYADNYDFNDIVTILVAAEGIHKMPTINSSEDVKEALEKLSSIHMNKTLNVELLWNPQGKIDTLTEQEMLENYSHLRLYK